MVKEGSFPSTGEIDGTILMATAGETESCPASLGLQQADFIHVGVRENPQANDVGVLDQQIGQLGRREKQHRMHVAAHAPSLRAVAYGSMPVGMWPMTQTLWPDFRACAS